MKGEFEFIFGLYPIIRGSAKDSKLSIKIGEINHEAVYEYSKMVSINGKTFVIDEYMFNTQKHVTDEELSKIIDTFVEFGLNKFYYDAGTVKAFEQFIKENMHTVKSLKYSGAGFRDAVILSTFLSMVNALRILKILKFKDLIDVDLDIETITEAHLICTQIDVLIEDF